MVHTVRRRPRQCLASGNCAKDMLSLSPKCLLPCAWEEMRVQRNPHHKFPQGMQKMTPRRCIRGKAGKKQDFLSTTQEALDSHPVFVKRVFFELEPKKLGPAEKDCFLGDTETREKNSAWSLEVESSQFQEETEAASRTSRYQQTGRKKGERPGKTRIFHTLAYAQLPGTSESL